MPGSSRPIDDRLILAERKRLLTLACAADRVAWQRACRPRPRPRLAAVAPLLRLLGPVATFLPGAAGRWLRRASFFARVARQLRVFVP